MSNTRIYLVQANGERTLVDATSRAQAANFVGRKFIISEVATQKDLIELLQAGAIIHHAVKPQEEAPIE